MSYVIANSRFEIHVISIKALSKHSPYQTQSSVGQLGDLDIKAQLILQSLLSPIIFVSMDMSKHESISRSSFFSPVDCNLVSFFPFIPRWSFPLVNLFLVQTFEKRQIFYRGIQNIIPTASGKVIPWEHPRCLATG